MDDMRHISQARGFMVDLFGICDVSCSKLLCLFPNWEILHGFLLGVLIGMELTCEDLLDGVNVRARFWLSNFNLHRIPEFFTFCLS